MALAGKNGFVQIADRSALTEVNTYPVKTLGDSVVVDGVIYTYVYNAANSAISSGLACLPLTGTTTGASCTVSSVAGDPIIGIAVSTISTGMYGWVATNGPANVKSATVATSKPIVAGANGVVAISSGATGTVIGYMMEAASGSTASKAYIRGM